MCGESVRREGGQGSFKGNCRYEGSKAGGRDWQEGRERKTNFTVLYKPWEILGHARDSLTVSIYHKVTLATSGQSPEPR